MKKLLFAIFFLFGPISASPGAELSRFEYEKPLMGTKFKLVLYALGKDQADQTATAAFDRVAALNQIMSDYLPDSELSKLCAANAKELALPTKVSDELFFVLSKAQEISTLSDGAFDVTIGPLIKLWRKARKEKKLPEPEAIKEALGRIGYQKLMLDPKAKTVAFKVPGMQLDLGGIAKGYASDEVLKLVKAKGIDIALCAASGDIAVMGKPPEKQAWKIEIGAIPGTTTERYVWLTDAAISSSGDAEQFVEIEGKRYSHIVDPKTGLGLTGRRSTTVIAPRGIEADSMTKMAMMLPPEKAIGIIEKRPGTHTLIIVKHEKGEDVRQSKDLVKILVKE